MKRVAQAIVFVAAALALTGCAAVVLGGAAGVGTVVYVKGELKELLPAAPEAVQEAIDGAVDALGLTRIKAEADALSGDYVARTATDERILIRYVRVGASTTEVRIRVGTFGDENLSRSVLGEIKGRLRASG